MTEKFLKSLNDRLGNELGWVGQYPRYMWAFSEDLTFLAEPIDESRRYTYKADENTGLILPVKVLEKRKMCPHLNRQWVLMAWQDGTDADASTLYAFGKCYYAFTDVALPEGIEPDQRWTWEVIDACRQAREKRAKDIERELEESRVKCEAERKENIREEIRENCPTYDHVVGTRDSVSYPSVTLN